MALLNLVSQHHHMLYPEQLSVLILWPEPAAEVVNTSLCLAPWWCMLTSQLHGRYYFLQSDAKADVQLSTIPLRTVMAFSCGLSDDGCGVYLAYTTTWYNHVVVVKLTLTIAPPRVRAEVNLPPWWHQSSHARGPFVQSPPGLIMDKLAFIHYHQALSTLKHHTPAPVFSSSDSHISKVRSPKLSLIVVRPRIPNWTIHSSVPKLYQFRACSHVSTLPHPWLLAP